MPSAAPTDEKVIVVDKARVKRVASIKTLHVVLIHHGPILSNTPIINGKAFSLLTFI